MRFVNRVTRLGEFSPIGYLFSLGGFLKITEIAQILVHGTSYALILTKTTGWATLWAMFSQAHLVTLVLYHRAKQCPYINRPSVCKHLVCYLFQSFIAKTTLKETLCQWKQCAAEIYLKNHHQCIFH
jgi:hypothetical protein